MSSLHARSALIASVMVVFGAGCAAGFTGATGEPAIAESQPGGAPPVVVATTDVDADLVYDPQGPVDDIEAYPSVIYLGVNVYYVDGRWYRHGKDGWGYFREEPRELGRQRELHDRDPRWARSPAAPVRAEPERPGVAERPGPERPGVAERQGPERATPPGRTELPIKTAAPAKKKAPAKKAAPPRAGAPREPRVNEERR